MEVYDRLNFGGDPKTMISANTQQAVNNLYLDPNIKWEYVPSLLEAYNAWKIAQQARATTQQTSKTFSLSPLSAEDILAFQDEPVKWVWQDYIAEGDLFIIAAYPKVGKSTFFYPLGLSVARGVKFLDRATTQGGVLALAMEEHIRDVRKRLLKLGLQKTDPIHVESKPVPNTTEGLKALAEYIRRECISLVFIDSLAAFWNIKSEIDNAEIQRVLDPLRQLARQENVAICLVHHESKFGGRDSNGNATSDGKSIRGGGALLGAVDQAITMASYGKSATRRLLSSNGRRAEAPRKLIIELSGEPALSNPKPYSFKVIGTPDQMTSQGYQDAMKEILTDEWQTIEEIDEQSAFSEDVTRKALEGLFEAGEAERDGKGKKGDPYKYRLSQPAQTPPGGSTSDSDSFPCSGLPNPMTSNTTNPIEPDA
jgi:hypothetical protein